MRRIFRHKKIISDIDLRGSFDSFKLELHDIVFFFQRNIRESMIDPFQNSIPAFTEQRPGRKIGLAVQRVVKTKRLQTVFKIVKKIMGRGIFAFLNRVIELIAGEFIAVVAGRWIFWKYFRKQQSLLLEGLFVLR